MAIRYLFGVRGNNIRRSLSAILGIGISVVPLILVFHLADGMIRGIVERFIETSNYHVQGITRLHHSVDELDRLAGQVEALPTVKAVIAEHQGIGIISHDGVRTGVTVRAVDTELWEKDEGFRRYGELQMGEFDLSRVNNIILGVAVAEKLSASVGDSIRIITTRSLPSGGLIPRVSHFVVRGIIATGYQDLDRMWVYIPLSIGVRILQDANVQQSIGVKLEDPYSLPNALFKEGRDPSNDMLRTVQAALGPGFRIFSWYSLQQSRWNSFRATKNMLIFIMVLLLIVASFNISSTLVMLVYEKQTELAILKSLGAPPASIVSIFLLCGAIIGMVGIALGMGLSIPLTLFMNEVLAFLEMLIIIGQRLFSENTDELFRRADFYLEHIPVQLHLTALLMVCGGTIFLSMLAAILPARRASRLNPLQIIRKT